MRALDMMKKKEPVPIPFRLTYFTMVAKEAHRADAQVGTTVIFTISSISTRV